MLELGRNFNDESLAQLALCFPYLKRLSIFENNIITSKGFKLLSDTIYSASLRNENCLEELQLINTNIDDELVLELKQRMPRLQITIQ